MVDNSKSKKQHNLKVWKKFMGCSDRRIWWYWKRVLYRIS